MGAWRWWLQKILIVDDEPDITASIKTGLAPYGYEVDAYNDPEIALSNFEQGKYSLAIIDFRMPKMNGFDLYRGIKSKDDKIKIFFLSAFEIYHEEFKKMFPESKVNSILRKPVGMDDLISRIRDELHAA